ncbi:MAG: hypothetical protein GVY36_13585 [Verrucomicrobia bacterium]|jgi:hypothetical protein|nr:hypothetical protein [Verrucomicrobiota bacterium]
MTQPSLQDFGFLYGKSGPHTARTLMLEELGSLLEAVDESNATLDAYRAAIIEDNCLSKASGKTRELTFRHLKELYGLDPAIPLFRTLLYFWKREPEGRPLLAALCAFPRDTIFRASHGWIIKFSAGEQIPREKIEERIAEAFPDRFSPASLKSIAQNLNSSWTKTGHLQGRVKKIRAKAKPTPASTAFALYLGYLNGVRGEELFHSPYAKVLDTRPAELMEKAEVASQRGWIVMKRLGNVIEVLLPQLITDEERRCLHEQ